MSIESKVYPFINKFRISPTGFEQEKAPEQTGIKRNPQKNINPLGTNVEALTLFVVSDTHYHVTNRQSYDRTAVMPTTRIFNRLRKSINPGNTDWHAKIRPHLYNSALAQWPSTVEQFLVAQRLSLTPHVLTVHAGDIGDDSLDQKEFTKAILETQNVMNKISRTFLERWGEDIRTSNIHLMGDHDADVRAWKLEYQTDQIRWLYRQLGLDTKPASYLQEVETKENTRKGILMLDTNLLTPEWVKTIRTASDYALNRLISSTEFNNLRLEDVVESDDVVLSLATYCQGTGKEELYAAIMTYKTVLEQTKNQQRIIEHARDLDSVILIGHKPKESMEVATTMKGQVTVISGHRHFAHDSNAIGFPFQRIIQKTEHGNPIRLLRLGAATVGAGGLEIKNKPVGFMIKIDQQDSEAQIYPVIQK